MISKGEDQRIVGLIKVSKEYSVNVDIESFKNEVESELDNGKEMLEATNKAKDELEEIADSLDDSINTVQKMIDDLDEINTKLDEMGSAISRAEEMNVQM